MKTRGRGLVVAAVAGILAVGPAPGSLQGQEPVPEPEVRQERRGEPRMREGREGRGPRHESPRFGRGPGRVLDGTPLVDRLLERREAMGLTDEQVAALEASRQRTASAMAPLRGRLDELRERMRAEGERRDALRADMRRIMEEAREIRLEAREELLEILTDEQKAHLRSREAPRREGRGMRRPPRGG